ncbi:MAG: C40 family peptidase [Intrasporangium sp.]|uniref:C40 family peptidase n=1 Tax=Intrasporangium sp. TaxID=1925024 RepID=UPI0026491E47|nr:C40 family peptidase [Intrasporangium sp.]MDN5794356.1 C40 family peptidase [Intrasporangium sp.]
MAHNPTGRHRVPGRFNPLAELRLIAKESAQPAVKGAAIVAASGGLIATVAVPATAAEAKPMPVVAEHAAGSSTTSAAAVIGPGAAVTKAGDALATIGFKPAAARKAKPIVIEDLVVKKQRAERARQEAAARAEAERAAQAERAAEARRTAAARSQTTSSRSSNRSAPSTNNTSKAASNPAPRASGIVGIAQSMFGVPYVYGGSSPSGFDCSGFTSWVYRQAGVSIPRTASAQQSAATRVSSPRPGDLVFFGYPAYHVGIYVSPGRLIDAQRPGTTVGNHSIWTTPSGYGRF